MSNYILNTRYILVLINSISEDTNDKYINRNQDFNEAIRSHRLKTEQKQRLLLAGKRILLFSFLVGYVVDKVPM